MQLESNEAQYRGKLRVAIRFVPNTSQDKVDLKLKRGSLLVLVKWATDLPQMDPKGLTDSFVKTYLLPKRGSFQKKKTMIVKNTLSPTWNELLEYKSVSLDDLSTGRVLELTVWDHDRRGCNDFIGCLRLGPAAASGDDGGSRTRKEWMDSTEKETEQWEAMLATPGGEWVEYEHDLRHSIVSKNRPSYSAAAKHAPSSSSTSAPHSDKLQGKASPSLAEVDEDRDSNAEVSKY